MSEIKEALEAYDKMKAVLLSCKTMDQFFAADRMLEIYREKYGYDDDLGSIYKQLYWKFNPEEL